MDTDEPKTNKKHRNTWIQEDADTIVDFTDPKVTNKISGTFHLCMLLICKTKIKILASKPGTSTNAPVAKKKNKDRGFKVASDGRLIIEDDSSSSDSDNPKKRKGGKFDDSDSGTLGFLYLQKIRIYKEINIADESGSDAETMVLTDKKRKRSEAGSVRSGFSGKSQPPMKYQAGGSGIHRYLLYVVHFNV